MPNVIRIALPVMVAVLSVGCAYGEVRQVVRAQFASDLDCGDVTVEKKGYAYFPDKSDSDRFKVVGCGAERTYTCPRDAGLVSYDAPTCPWVLGDPDRPKAVSMKPAGVDPFGDQAADDAVEPEVGDGSPANGTAPAKKKAPANAPKTK